MHAEGVDEADQRRHDRHEERDLQRAGPGVGVDVG